MYMGFNVVCKKSLSIGNLLVTKYNRDKHKRTKQAKKIQTHIYCVTIYPLWSKVWYSVFRYVGTYNLLQPTIYIILIFRGAQCRGKSLCFISSRASKLCNLHLVNTKMKVICTR